MLRRLKLFFSLLFLCFLSACFGPYEYIIDQKENKVSGDDIIIIRTMGSSKTRRAVRDYEHPNLYAASRISGIISEIGCDTVGSREKEIKKGHFRAKIQVSRMYKKGGSSRFFDLSDVEMLSFKLSEIFKTMNSSQSIFFRYAGYNVYMFVRKGELTIRFDTESPSEKRNYHLVNSTLKYRFRSPKSKTRK